MDQQHGGADAVEQRRGGIAVERLLQREIHQRGKLARIELVEARIAWLAGARPLGVQMRLRPLVEPLRRDKALLKAREIRRRHRPVRLRPLRRAPARHLIDHVDRVAAAQEILRPALASIRRAGEVGAGLAAAMDHHHRIRMGDLLRHLEFHVHVADRRGAFAARVDGAATKNQPCLAITSGSVWARAPAIDSSAALAAISTVDAAHTRCSATW